MFFVAAFSSSTPTRQKIPEREPAPVKAGLTRRDLIKNNMPWQVPGILALRPTWDLKKPKPVPDAIRSPASPWVRGNRVRIQKN
jgi:hypothetical protein